MNSILWLTGLSGAGKSTLARALAETLKSEDGRPVVVLDGDAVRRGLSSDLGFSEQDRSENVRRIAEVAALVSAEGCTVVVAMIAPRANDRARARAIAVRAACGFWEIHVATPLEVCEARDPKGYYARARRGELRDFTGIGAPYETPARADLRVDTSGRSLPDCVRQIQEFLAGQAAPARPV